MIQFSSSRAGRPAGKRVRTRLPSLLGAASLLLATPLSAAPLPYPQAVSDTDQAARAVLARAGVESCLRGKLTRALLGLSSSCEASGTSNPLCSLADKAVVVTPMSLAFMDATSRQLLELINPGVAGPQASARGVEPQPASEP